MTQEEKDLLLKDLSSRLPYGVKCNVGDDKPYTLSRIEIDDKNGHLLDFKEKKDSLDMQVYLSECRPYLLPLSSMTEEQEEELIKYMAKDWNDMRYHTPDSIDWLNKNHFDFRNLIGRGLAIDCTNLNIY